MSREWQLLTKAQVMREYAYPAHLLDSDLQSGKLPAFLPNGKGVVNTMWTSRYYIPRIAVERRIAELAGMEWTP